MTNRLIQLAGVVAFATAGCFASSDLRNSRACFRRRTLPLRSRPNLALSPFFSDIAHSICQPLTARSLSRATKALTHRDGKQRFLAVPPLAVAGEGRLPRFFSSPLP